MSSKGARIKGFKRSTELTVRVAHPSGVWGALMRALPLRLLPPLLVLLAMSVVVVVACTDETPTPTREPTATPTITPVPTATPTATPAPTATPTNTPVPTAAPAPLPDATPTIDTKERPADDPFSYWNDALEPQPWWRESKPYTCVQPAKESSPWIQAGMTDLGGADPLSLIKYFGNGSYIRYGFMGFEGCAPMAKYPDRTHLDPPVDPTYFSLGDLTITVDIARVPPDAPGWFEDDGRRETMSMDEAVNILNTHVTPYFEKISEGKLRMQFVPGNDFPLEGEGSPKDLHNQQMRLAGVMDCRGKLAEYPPCDEGAPGGLNRIMLTDVTRDAAGDAYNGHARFGLVSLRKADMETLAHEIGHGWMMWPHSYTEIVWRPYDPDGEVEEPDPYSNVVDFMSALVISHTPALGWHQDMPSTLAINRYAAGWIDPAEVALHLKESGTYTLQPPRKRGNQFLVISSGRPYAFTTVEMLDERNPAYFDETHLVYDPARDSKRPFRYAGVLVSRYDQTTGAGVNARFGPALYDTRNPNAATDVGWGLDDYSIMQHGDRRDIGGGVSVEVSRRDDGSYEVAVTGGRVAEFEPWCTPIWFGGHGEYDTGCLLEGRVGAGG